MMKSLTKRMSREGGFTLIELIVVVIVLGVLATMAVPRMVNMSDRAEYGEGQRILGSMKSAMEMHLVEFGEYPDSTSTADDLLKDSAAENVIGQYVDDFGFDQSNWEFEDLESDSPEELDGESTDYTIEISNDDLDDNLILYKIEDEGTEIERVTTP